MQADPVVTVVAVVFVTQKRSKVPERLVERALGLHAELLGDRAEQRVGRLEVGRDQARDRVPGIVGQLLVKAPGDGGLAGADGAEHVDRADAAVDHVLALGEHFLMLGSQEEEARVRRDSERLLLQAVEQFIHRPP